MAREPERIAELRLVLGERLAAFRRAADLTQGGLAELAYCDRTRITHIEKGRARADEQFWKVADQACQANGVLLGAFHELEAAKATHMRRAHEQSVAAA